MGARREEISGDEERALDAYARAAATEIRSRFDGEETRRAQVAPFAVTVEEMIEDQFGRAPGREEIRRRIRRYL